MVKLTLQNQTDKQSSVSMANKILSLLQTTWRIEHWPNWGIFNTLGQPTGKYIFVMPSLSTTIHIKNYVIDTKQQTDQPPSWLSAMLHTVYKSSSYWLIFILRPLATYSFPIIFTFLCPYSTNFISFKWDILLIIVHYCNVGLVSMLIKEKFESSKNKHNRLLRCYSNMFTYKYVYYYWVYMLTAP